jgi:ABC-type lipoprotein export system ATPase subunit
MKTHLPATPLKSKQDIILMHDVVKKYKNTAGEITVLKGLDLTLRKGEFVAIIGKSGSGKSTLINMITGIDHPTSGEVIVAGQEIYAMNESQRSLWRGRSLGIVFQFFQLLPMLTLLENVMLPMDYVNNYDFDDRPKRAMELLQLVGLEKFAHKLPVAVSTGQQQCAAIARALANDPPIITADEPTGNLDSRSSDVIINLFNQLVKRGKTIVMVTHDPSLTGKTSRTLTLSDGELINENVAKSLPLLTHPQMLAVTHLLDHREYPPATTILKHGDHVDNFFIIEEGTVEIVLHEAKPKSTVLAKMGPGEFFGEVELMRGGKSIASVRTSASEKVKIVALNRQVFLDLIKKSPLTEQALGMIVQARLKQNRIADRRSQDREGI